MAKISLITAVKRGYVGAARAGARVARGTGLLTALEARSDRRWAQWLRSLAAIHDIDDMIYLDVPWWTYDAITAVEAFLRARPGARVLEYGSGASTVWLARRAGSVTSIEHDADWGGLVRDRLAGLGLDNATLVEIPPEPATGRGDPDYGSTKAGYREQSFKAYVTAVADRPGPYDLIVIDGRARAACLKAARPYLAEGGLVVFDNTGRPAYIAAMEASGGTVRHLPGLAPGLPYRDRTSLVSFP